MPSMHRVVRFWTYALLGFLLVLGMASCSVWHLLVGGGPLPEVAALPVPQLPEWIEQISPIGEAEPLAQIRIRFQDPLIPVERLESPDQQEILSKFELVPALPGQFRFLTPRMVGFQADAALPKATRIRVTLKAGLADLNEHQLEQDLAWTFNTDKILLTDLPGLTGATEGEIDPIDLKPTLTLTSNLELDLKSLREQVSFKSGGRSLPLQVALQDNDSADSYDQPPDAFDPSQRPWIYTLTPRRELEKATRYQLTIAPGLRPAHGNLPSETAFTSQIQTYAPLAFQDLHFVNQPDAGGAYGRFVQGSAQLRFNNGLMAESAVQHISIQPPPKEAPQLVRMYDGDRLVDLNPWSLDPATSYTITLGADLTDKFGQRLGQPMTVKYNTGDVAADLWAPSGLNIFPRGNDLQLNISAVNLPNPTYQAAYRVVQPTDLVYTDSAYPRGIGQDLLPNPNTWDSFPITGPKNQTTEVAVPLRNQLGRATGMLAYGVKAPTHRYSENGQNKWREASFYGLVQVTNLGVFTQWFPDSGLVRVHHLSDGSAVRGARVEIYESRLEAGTGGTPAPCATGQTDPTGTWRLDAEALQGCMPNGQSVFSTAPQLLTIAREGSDWAFARSLEYSGDYGYGIYAGWDSDQPQSRGTIFSDRQLYKPGETAWFTGTAYYLKNGTLQQDRNVRYTVTVDDPNGQAIALEPQTTNAFGTFSVQWQIPPTQPLGNYSIRARAENGIEIWGEFRVAEFKPPNFKVDLTLDRETAFINDTLTATTQSQYLFGSPVQGGQVTYYVTREQTDFTPPGWDTFSFGRRWFWPEESPTVSSDVLQVSGALDEQGQSRQTVTIAEDLPYPMTYRVDAEVADVSNLSVASSKTVTALPSDRLIGLKSDFVAEAGKPFSIQAIVTDPTGKPISGQRVQVELQQMIYSSVTQVIEGSQQSNDQVEYKTVEQTDLRSGNAPQTLTLTPPESGSYRIRANLANARNDLSATDVQLWATGPAPTYWGSRYSNNRLDLQLDKARYQPGETATVLIQSPYPEADLYLAVVRHETLYQTIMAVKGGAPQLQFQVTPDMLPNAAIEAVLVRQGEPLSQVAPDSLDNLVRIGFAPFNVDLQEKYLTVSETVQSPSLQPGAEQTVDLTLTDGQGNPVQGQFTVMVVNEAVLQLTGYRPPNLVDTVYAEQAISTRFADNRPDVVLQPLSSPLDKGWGYGGGFSAGVGNTRIRTDFKPLAYYNGSVLTDANGRARITFPLPDDLTTWRVMAIATDGELRFGQQDATFITTQPLVSNPILPQFARPGDRFEVGVSVTNPSDQQGTLTINGTLGTAQVQSPGASTSPLQFTDRDQEPLTQHLQTSLESGTQAYRFPVVAQAGTATVQFTTQLGRISDAFEVPLTVKPLEITEQVVETGTTESRVEIPVNVDNTVVPEAGGLEIALASTLIPELTAPARHVLDEAQLPFLEPAASQLLIAANLQSLSQQYGQTFSDFNLTQQATQAIERLQRLQRPDGGFAAWPGQEQSDPFVSPYAAEAIARGIEAFGTASLQPNSELVTRLKAYLSSILADPGQYDVCQDDWCKPQIRLNALLALDALGDRRQDFLSDLYAQRDAMSPVMQIKLVRYLSLFPAWQPEAAALADSIQETLYETGRTATVNLPQGWSWLSSTTAAQAEALRLFIVRQRPPETLDRLLQALLALRRDGTWATTYDNAQALTALVDYSQLQPAPPRFTATARLAGKTLISHSFQGYQTPSVDQMVPMADLPRGRHNLTLQKTGQGTLHYLTAYRYRLQGDQPGRLNGLRVTRRIHPANQEKVLAQMGLNPPQDAIAVSAGEVFDIELEIITDHPIDHLVITDPLPAGFEAVDTSFQTSTPSLQAQFDSWQIGYQTIHSDRVEAYGDRLDAGVYTLHYLVRSVTPGTFLYPGANVHLQYAPEEFGRTASSTLLVQ